MKRRTFFAAMGAVLAAACGVKAKPAYSGGAPINDARLQEALSQLAKLSEAYKRRAASKFRSADSEPPGATTTTREALRFGGMCNLNCSMDLDELAEALRKVQA